MSRRQILCLSGGGYAGLFAAKLLALLEAQLPQEAKIGDRFDAFAGTSVGGLMALALASGNSAAQVLAVMQSVGKSVFPRKRGGMLRAIWGPKYAVKSLRAHASTLLENKTLGDLTHPALITAVSLTSGEPRLFRALPGKSDPDSAIPLLDVALATSAAPLYFPPHKVGENLCADGGLVANAPDHLAILEAIHRYGWASDDLWILSIGTTYTPPGVLTHSTRGWGLVKWLRRDRKLLAISMNAQMQLAHTIATRLVPVGRLLRIDPPLSPAQAKAIGLDVADQKATATLQALAQTELDRMNALQRQQFLNHVVRPL